MIIIHSTTLTTNNLKLNKTKLHSMRFGMHKSNPYLKISDETQLQRVKDTKYMALS